jgi:hypothetical protein
LVEIAVDDARSVLAKLYQQLRGGSHQLSAEDAAEVVEVLRRYGVAAESMCFIIFMFTT